MEGASADAPGGDGGAGRGGGGRGGDGSRGGAGRGGAGPRGRPYHHGDLPSALLDAVASLIDEAGLDAVTLRAAARRAGVSHAAPAHHFGDKSGMLAAFAQQGFDRFTATLRAAREANDGPPAQGMEAMGRAYLAFARDHRPWFEVMFRPELIGGHTEQLAEHGFASFQVLLDQVTDCYAPGVAPQQLLGRSLSAWATVHGLAQLLVDGPLEQLPIGPPDELVEAVLDTLVRGMRAHPDWIGDALAT
jgi:AcrR family transcriptional regulator